MAFGYLNLVTATEEMTLKFYLTLIMYVTYTARTVLRSLMKIDRHVPHDPAIPPPGV